MTAQNLEMFETQLKPLSEEVLSLHEQVKSLEINNDDDYVKAGDLATIVNDKKKDIDKLRKFFTDPLNTQVKSINGLFNPKIDEADEIVKTIKGKMSFYFDKKEEARLAEEKRLQAIRDAANKKREEAGKEIIAEPVKQVAETTRLVASDNSKTTVKKVWTHEIISLNELPEEIKKAIFAEAYRKGICDTVIKKFVDAGMREMTGVRIFEKSSINLLKK